MITKNDFNGLASMVEPVGSRITCVPAPTDTDADFLVLVEPENFSKFDEFVHSINFEMGGSEILAIGVETGDERKFQSYTREEVNIIVTSSTVFFQRFMRATSIAKEFNILGKSYRVQLFQALLYGATK